MMEVPVQQNRRSQRASRSRFLTLARTIAIGVQIPFCWALGRALGHPWLVVAVAALLTSGFVTSLQTGSPWHSPGRLRLYGVLWPFFIWWTAALIFLLLAPLALIVGALLGLATPTTLEGTLVLSALGSIRSLWQRPRLRAREIAIDGLPAAFDGYRIAQISDLHCGPFASGARVDGWVAAVNELQADLVAVTGDLITSGNKFVPVVAASLGKLRARDGVFACMGNHDYFTDGEELALALETAGLTLLRNRGVDVLRDGSALHVAGVDDTWTQRHDLDRALADRGQDAPVVLLAHDPALFPEAAARDVDLTLSGHTHGGQIGIPLLSVRFNLARIITRFTTGFYRLGRAALYVNRGLGTTGPPIRLAVAPEIALLTLRAS